MKLPVIALLIIMIFNPTSDINPEVDELYKKLSETVASGDYEGYAALYHDDAVLVDAMSGESIPIEAALKAWKPGFDETRAGNVNASVEFRFSQRLHGEKAAHDTGIFHYVSQKQGEDKEEVYIHFEGLFVYKDGVWKFIMEYQKAAADKEEWDSLKE